MESLIYLIAVRPDIIHVVGLISKFIENPKELHLLAAKMIFRCLKGIVDFELVNKRGEKTNLIGFSDSDYAGDMDDRKSTFGYVFMLSSGVVSWSSKKQPIVTLSIIEAEFIAVIACA
ncbi:secreted RxLR effector protein 161-like [Capsicum annuum]|uniref:secreted RxLR effector protein 161-like n=1 Tax=Capsicum annuum TaxID=4072 RepID=UPI001FB157E5|nr:secreted RxLR effector protein 161-like [Capsicum annuum]